MEGESQSLPYLSHCMSVSHGHWPVLCLSALVEQSGDRLVVGHEGHPSSGCTLIVWVRVPTAASLPS